MNALLLSCLLVALSLSSSFASPVTISQNAISPFPPQEVLSSGPISSLAVSSSLYDNFVLYAKYSSAAYLTPTLCRNPLGSTRIATFSTTHGYISRDDRRREIVVVFRGTLSVKDVKADLKFLQEEFKSPGIPESVRVHRGFLSAYQAVAEDVLAEVKQQLNSFPTYRIVVTGHSLGGAIASLAALSLKIALPDVPLQLYTFGQPRVGNKIFAKHVERTIGVDSIFRTVHRNDGVPTMLPRKVWALGLEYEHFATEYWDNPGWFSWSSPKSVTKCRGGEDPDCSNKHFSKGITLAHPWYFWQSMVGNLLVCPPKARLL
ncbi:putative feruloyl esterase A [Mycena venus]|uniref:Putative feruloyl esterase A n=1 Tax=Mycena venus TaxID=2733690 RepID=A0A8H7CW14_9AGAR|nr:putative feruloyl esterase A [Mycena venus]